MSGKVQDADMTEAAAEYLWSVCGQGKLAPLSVMRRPDLDDAENDTLVAGVRTKLMDFRRGARLTGHRSVDGYEVYREPYRTLLRDIVDQWQRGEIPGGTARLMTGSRSYGDLWGLARELDVEIRFMPRDVAALIVSGDVTSEEGQRLLGIEDDEIAAFVEAWTA